jgi:ankyrin repeat protein
VRAVKIILNISFIIMNYNNKYLKYKNKYIKLKNQIGASKMSYDDFIPIECSDNIYYNNRDGSCFNSSLQIMLLFSDKTKKTIQYNLIYIEPNDLIENANQLLLNLLPEFLLSDDKKELLPTTKTFLIKLINFIKNRFKIKIDEYNNKQPNSLPILRRSRSFNCEYGLDQLWLETFKFKIGHKEQQFLLVNILSSLLLNEFISIDNIYDNKIIDFKDDDTNNDTIGYTFHTNNHAISCYFCKDKTFIYNNGIIIEFQFNNFINKIKELNNNSSKFDIYIDYNSPSPYIKYDSEEIFFINKEDQERKIRDVDNNYINFHKFKPKLSDNNNDYSDSNDIVRKIIKYKFYTKDIDKIKLESHTTYINLYSSYIDSSYFINYITENNLFEYIDKYTQKPLLITVIINENIVKLLIDNPLFNLNLQNNKGDTALNFAVNKGNINIVKLLISNPKCNLNIQNKWGHTALIEAVRHRYIDIIKLLINNPKCNLNLQSDVGNTALIETLSKGYFYIKELLKDTNRDTALIDLVHQEITDIVTLLINKSSCDLNIQNKWRHTALHTAVYHESINIIKLLINKPTCNLNLKGSNRNTALIEAVYKGKIDIVKLLIDKPWCNLNLQNKWKDTALHTAVYDKNIEIIKLLVNKPRCDLNLKDKNGNTSLHTAVEEQNIEIIKLLIYSSRCDLNLKNDQGESAYKIAIILRNKQIQDLFELMPTLDSSR